MKYHTPWFSSRRQRLAGILRFGLAHLGAPGYSGYMCLHLHSLEEKGLLSSSDFWFARKHITKQIAPKDSLVAYLHKRGLPSDLAARKQFYRDWAAHLEAA